MAIVFHPSPRTVLICNFETGFARPEMTKIRPVVVISPQRDNRETCIVVPLSTLKPKPVEAFHCMLNPKSLPPQLRSRSSWVKANLITTVALWRLDRVMNRYDGRTVFASYKVTRADWNAIQHAVIAAIGFEARSKFDF